MAMQTTLEIMVQQHGRWVIHARYPVTKKDAAVEEAKALEKTPGIGAVKVIKDVYDQKRGTSSEYIVYKSATVKMETSKTAAPARPSPAAASFDEPQADERPRPRPAKPAAKPMAAPARKSKSSLGEVMLRLLAVLICGGIGGAAITFGIHSALAGRANLFGISLLGDSGANFYLAVFIISFLAVAGLMSSILLGGKGIEMQEQKKEMPVFKPKAAAAKKAPAQPTPSGVKAAPEAPEPTPDELAQQLREAAADILNAAAGKAEEASPMAETEAAPAAAAPAAADTGISPPLDPNVEKQKTYMLRFLGRTLEQVATTQKKLDSYTKFGLNLFLAGACEIMCQKRDLDAATRARLLAEGVQALGFKADHAAGFAGNYESYLLQDARYMQMFQAGRNAMNTYFSDEDEGLKHLTAAIADWSKPKPREEASQVVTVMFTDMVGSTALTQTRGQQVAQQVVRAHNRIVRQALTRFHGREIKHTGDGIMASFAQASSAVDAAIQIQKDTLAHCRDYPDLPLQLKIGLNAGEPIAEDGDLFGSTVQLSARITDKAKANEIFVPDSVRLLCAGKNYRFVSRGGYAMKGFEGDITLYEVVWDEELFARKQAGEPKGPAPKPAAAPARPAAARPAAAAMPR
ncbi:MAG: adenylate/guanylate cyclase domain-containing protein [Rhodospirillales bacterium]|nr:adenylate/guanylate cyclase domain-containing protein [Rhodospirillales bacterium]